MRAAATLLVAVALALAASQPVQIPVDATGASRSFADDQRAEEWIKQNLREHEAECAQACDSFFCGPVLTPELPGFSKYPMGPPSNDFPEAFEHDEQIFVTNEPLFAHEECEHVISLAEAEGGGLPSTRSGKYQIGKAWVKEMPGVLVWFNSALESKLFPALAALFPALVSDGSQLRAHSVAILKYNESHPRTDVHVDDALLAFTLVLSPSTDYVGGGTYFEAINSVVPMAQGHVTFRPGSVRHAGAPVSSGLRYVLGGFIALADRVEHVRRLNERGNRILLGDAPTRADLEVAERLFRLGATLNPKCSLCSANLGDVLLRLERPAEAEVALRAQAELLPRDSDAFYSLGVSLHAQGRDAEAVEAYSRALAIEPNDSQCLLALAAAHASLQQYADEQAAYKAALQLDPNDVVARLNLGMSYTSTDDMEAAEAIFKEAQRAAPRDARPSISLGRLYAKLSRPAEAIDSFYAAALTDPEYFDEVKMSVGTARAQQGRISEARDNFESALRMDPKNEKLAASLEQMGEESAVLLSKQEHLSNAVSDLCGTPCQDVVDGSSVSVCAIRWSDGCGDAPPPEGFTSDSTVAELCAHACAFFLLKAGKL